MMVFPHLPWLIATDNDPALMADFAILCAFGGRLSGSGQDSAALNWALGRLRAAGARATRLDVPYDGWRCLRASLALAGPRAAALSCWPLLRSASTAAGGLEAEVVDLGPGRQSDFARLGGRLRGRIALVCHEYPYAAGHVHHNRKYDMAVAAGAAGFLIANPWEGGGLLAGWSGRPRGTAGIPAASVDHASARRLSWAAQAGPARVRMVVEGEETPRARAGVGVADLPGGRDGWIVISAHVDGLDLGNSALDNASGVAVALAAARALARRVGPSTPGLRICLFTAKEWGLAGSARYLAQMGDGERNSLKLNINLDTVAGDDSLTALTSGFPGLPALVRRAGDVASLPIGVHEPLMPDSDHASFACHGIPALRLLAGFERPASRARAVLGANDRTSIVKEDELQRALRATCAMAGLAMALSDAELANLAERS